MRLRPRTLPCPKEVYRGSVSRARVAALYATAAFCGPLSLTNQIVVPSDAGPIPRSARAQVNIAVRYRGQGWTALYATAVSDGRRSVDKPGSWCHPMLHPFHAPCAQVNIAVAIAGKGGRVVRDGRRRVTVDEPNRGAVRCSGSPIPVPKSMSFAVTWSNALAVMVEVSPINQQRRCPFQIIVRPIPRLRRGEPEHLLHRREPRSPLAFTVTVPAHADTPTLLRALTRACTLLVASATVMRR